MVPQPGRPRIVNNNSYIILAGWKTLVKQNNFLTIDLSEDKDLDDH